MEHVRRKVIAFCLILLSTLTIFYGCSKNKYKDLKLDVSDTELEIVLDERPENNIFSISAFVSGMPKGYNGAVSFSVPVNDFISITGPSTPDVNKGQSICYFEAKKQGGPVYVTVRTLEGNLHKQIKVKVINPLASLNFKESLLPIVIGQKTDISKFVNAEPQGTLQSDIKLEISSTDVNADLSQIVVDGKYVTVPVDSTITDFQIKAISTVNEEITTEVVNAKVINIIPTNQIYVVDMITNYALTIENDVYTTKLGLNTDNLYSKQIYFSFNNIVEENENYTVSVKGLNAQGQIVDDYGNVDKVVEIDDLKNQIKNAFSINAIGNGKTTVEFLISRTDFPNHSEFVQTVKLNVVVSDYPKTVTIYDDKELVYSNSKPVVLYANYENNVIGTPFKVAVSNENGKMANQQVYLNFVNNNGDSIADLDKIKIYNEFEQQMSLTETFNAGSTYYINHSFEIAPMYNIFLQAVAVVDGDKYGAVHVSVPVEVETEQMILSTPQQKLSIDATQKTVDTPLIIEGLPVGYDFNNLKYEYVNDGITDASTLVQVKQDISKLTVTPIAGIGECSIRVIAENGSSLTFTIVLFESINTNQSSITVAGVTIQAADIEIDDSVLQVVKVTNRLNLNIKFVVNDKEYSTLVGTGLLYSPSSSATNIVQAKQDCTLSTQNTPGEAIITLRVTGFNELGEQVKNIYFKFKVEVTVPLESLLVATSEVYLYDSTTLSSSQIEKHGQHEIVLVSAPNNAIVNNVIWTAEIDGIEYPFYLSYSTATDNVYQATTAYLDVITLKVPKNNVKRATVSCQIYNAGSSRLIFNILAKVEQTYTNHAGTEINNTKSVSVRCIVEKAVKVQNFMFNNVSVINGETSEYYELVFDERDLGLSGSSYTTNKTKEITFEIYPSNALYKDLAYSLSGGDGAIEVSIDNPNKVISVTINRKYTTSAVLTVYPLDDVIDGNIGKYKQIKISVLDGSEANPFRISTQADLIRINDSLSSHYVLSENVTLSSNWTPIGTSGSNVLPFTGSLSGKYVYTFEDTAEEIVNYYSINGLTIVNNSFEYYGLFAYIGNVAKVSDLIINSVSISANVEHNNNVYVGALAGYSEGIITNVTVNDLSGVQAFNGTYYESVVKGTMPQQGINIFAQTSASEFKSYYFVGGLVGFVNNTWLQSETNTVVAASVNATNGETLKSNYKRVGSEIYNKHIVNSNTAVNLNVYVNTNKVGYVGGLVGFNNRAVIENQQNNEILFGSDSANVVSAINANLANNQLSHNLNSAFGGVAGFNNGIINGTIAKASILGVYNRDDSENYMQNLGGIAGYNTGEIKNTTSYPLIRGYKNIGGVVGTSSSAVVTLKQGSTTYVNGKAHYDTSSESIAFNRSFDIIIETFENVNNASDSEHLQVNRVSLTNGLVETYNVTGITNAARGGSHYDIYTIKQIALGLATYGSNVLDNNKVELLDCQDELTAYNTALIGRNNVGGLAGEFNGITAPEGLKNAGSEKILNYVTYNPIEYNIVYNYSLKPVIASGETSTTSYYGNILATGTTSSVGGLVGLLNNGSLVYNQVFAVLQGSGDNLGGLVGSAAGVTQISNSSFVGVLYDATSTSKAGFIANANEVTLTYLTYNGGANTAYSDLKINHFRRKLGGFNSSEVYSGTNNISLSYYSATDNNGLYITDKYVGSSANNITVDSYTFNATDIIDTTKLNNFNSRVGTYIVSNAGEDVNADGLKDSQTGLDYSVELSDFVSANLNTAWYSNYQLNNGLPVLLSKDKAAHTGYLNGENLEYAVSLLANFPPTDITVTQNKNYIDVFIASIGGNLHSVVYFYELADSSYLPDFSAINFGDNNAAFTDAAVKALTTQLNGQILDLNTYSMQDIFDLTAIPTFVNGNSFIIKSSNQNILGIDTNFGNLQFIARGTGEVDITISSAYNASLSKTVKVNVVNATDNLGLSYYQAGDKKDVYYNSNINISKSSENNIITLSLSSNLSASYQFNNARANKTFKLNSNNNAFVRYYLLGSNNSIYHNYAYANLDSLIKFNGKNFTVESHNFGGTLYNTYYVDVPYGVTADIVGLEETTLNFLAVPYLNINNSYVSVVELGTNTSSITFEYENNNGTASDTVYGLQNVGSVEYLNNISKLIKKFTVNVKKANWKITKSTDNIVFTVSNTPKFTIEVETDKELADTELFIVYTDEYGDQKVTTWTNFINPTNRGGFAGKIKMGNLTLLANNKVKAAGSKYVTFNFGLIVQEADKINVSEILNKTFTFFVAKEDAPTITYDGKFVTNDISTIADSNIKIDLPVTLIPQEIVDIRLRHYPNSESTITTDENGNKITNINLNEVAYDNIIPGHVGVLKAYISPYYSNFDSIEILSSGSGLDSVTFEQLLANTERGALGTIYSGTYKTLIDANNLISGGIKLQKLSNLYADGTTEFDGYIYIRTLINSYVTEVQTFTLTFNAYNDGELVKTQAITLKVQLPPSLNLTTNGSDKIGYIARGTEQEFYAAVRGYEGDIDFSESYMYYVNANGNEVNIGSSYFNIRSINGHHYLSVDLNVPVNTYNIKIIGTITKEINGEVVTHTDSINLTVVDYVINGIYVDRVINGGFYGAFNQPYSLIVKVDATYNATISDYIEPLIKKLEKDFSAAKVDENGNTINNEIKTWYTVNTLVNDKAVRYGNLNVGYNNEKTFVIGTRFENDLDGIKVYTLQNIKFNSGDKLAARVFYRYSADKGPIICESNEDGCIEAIYEFGFNFYRDRDEDRPDPISTVEEFKNMQDGVDYILLNDLTLTDWKPFRDDLKINSFDGNGYVITLESFDLDSVSEDVEGAEDLISNKNIGIFGKINSGTTIKNLIIQVNPSYETNSIEVATYEGSLVDLSVDASAYSNVNFGVLAGENAGIITNVQVVHDAGELMLDRELAFAQAYPDDPRYVNYVTTDASGHSKFNKNTFIFNNLSKFYPRASGCYLVNDIGITIVTISKNEKLQNVTLPPGATFEDYMLVPYYAENEARRDTSLIKVKTTTTVDVQSHYMAGLVGQNLDEGDDAIGYITNSSVDNISINGVGYVAGFVANNMGKISTSYFKGGNIINNVSENFTQAATGGFVVYNKGTNAQIQYSYAQGRSGESSRANGYYDKTGLIYDTKVEFAGVAYANQSQARPNIAALRALNSVISSNTYASAFVYENDGLVQNSYANIMVNSSMRTSGFVFNNTANGKINLCYSLSSVRLNSMDASPFTGRAADYSYNNVSEYGITDSHYLKLGSNENCTDLETTFAEEFLDTNELATEIGASQFGEYNTFQGFAFNTDFEENSVDRVTRAVWFIPNVDSQLKLSDSLKNNANFISARPELVGANLKTQSFRVWTGNEYSTENSYVYISSPIGEDTSNPRLIKSAEEFNRYLNVETLDNKDESSFAIRFISDISFNKSDLTAQTYNITYYGDLDGNGMTINNLRLVSDTDFETTVDENGNASAVTYLGLFGQIVSKQVGTVDVEVPVVNDSGELVFEQYSGTIVNESGETVEVPMQRLQTTIVKKALEVRGVVRNLNLDVSEVRGSKVPYVGALAGKIDNADVFNVNITGDEVIQGRNIVGGLAGLVAGDSQLVNITSSLSAKSAYFSESNKFSANYATALEGVYGGFNLYYASKAIYEQNTGALIKEYGEENNAEYVSYVGGIAGVFDVNTRSSNIASKTSLFNAKGRKLSINGNISLIGEVVGGIIGLNGSDATLSDLSFEVPNGGTPQLIASRMVGGLIGENRGSVERSYLAHEKQLQDQIDETYKNAVAGNALNPTVYSSNLNYNNLFAGNPHYMGGLVGFNNGGTIDNCYNRINVVNINSMFAGGVVGLNVAGRLSHVYTTASVNAFRIVGGTIGILTYNPYFNFSGGTAGGIADSFQATATGIAIPNFKEYIFFNEGTGEGNYNKYVVYKDGESATEFTSEGDKTVLNAVVSANIWRKEDLVTNRRNYHHNAGKLRMGAYIGTALLYEDILNAGKHDLSLFFNIASLNARKKDSETNFMVLSKYNHEFTSDTYIMSEFGAINENIFDYAAVENNEFSDKISNNDANYPNELCSDDGYSVSTLVHVDGQPDVTYYASRLKCLGSARTIKEVINIKYMQTEEKAFGVSEEPDAGDRLPPDIFATWKSSRWTGVRKETEADIKTVFPYIEAKPELTVIELYKVEDLLYLQDNPDAEFIIMNDIDFYNVNHYKDSGNLNNIILKAAGTKVNPFRGKIHSVKGECYTISNFTVQENENYCGLIGYARDATFENFNLANVTVDGKIVVDEFSSLPLTKEQKARFVGSLLAYSSSGTVINNVNLTTVNIEQKVNNGNGEEIQIIPGKNIINSNYAATVGGLVGYSGGGTIQNSTVQNLSLNVSEFGNIRQLETEQEHTLAFGGLVGQITSAASDTNATIVLNSEVKSTVINVQTLGKSAKTIKGSSIHSIDIGGVVGRGNDGVREGKFSGLNSNVAFKVAISGDYGSQFSEVNIGGIIGQLDNAYLIENQVDVEILQKVEEKNYVEVGAKAFKLNNYSLYSYTPIGETSPVEKNDIAIAIPAGETNFGGAVGKVVGTANAGTYHVSNVKISDGVINTKTSVTAQTSKLNMGGLIGYAYNAKVKDAFIYTSSINAIAGFRDLEEFNIGGAIGLVENCEHITNIYVNDTNGNAVSFTQGTHRDPNVVNLGGAFGKVSMAEKVVMFEDQPGIIEKVIARPYVRAYTETAVKYHSSDKYYNVGGFAGLVKNGIIRLSVAGADVVVQNPNSELEDDYKRYIAVGGFVGNASLSNIGLSEVTIENCYTYGDIRTYNMFNQNNRDNHFAGGFVGVVQHATTNEGLIIKNTFSLTKFNPSDDATFTESENKGGFLGGFYHEYGTDNSNINLIKNMLFNNNYYVSEFIQYGNDYGSKVNVYDFMFSTSGEEYLKSQGFGSEEDVWEFGGIGTYPALKWINQSKSASLVTIDVTENPSDPDNPIETEQIIPNTLLYATIEGGEEVVNPNLENSVAGVSVFGTQASGSEIKPIVADDSTEFESWRAYIINNEIIQNLSTSFVSTSNITRNVTLYFNPTDEELYTGDPIVETDNRTVIYGFTSNGENLVTTNNGLIVNSLVINKTINTSVGSIAENNLGIIYQVSFYADDINKIEKSIRYIHVVRNNGGFIDSVDASNITIQDRKFITYNNDYTYTDANGESTTATGYVYRLVIGEYVDDNDSAGPDAFMVGGGFIRSSYVKSSFTGKAYYCPNNNSGVSKQGVELNLTELTHSPLDPSGYDFVNDFTAIYSAGKYLPVLQFELKGKTGSRTNFNGEILPENYWINNTEEISLESLNNGIVEIDNASKLAYIAKLSRDAISEENTTLTEELLLSNNNQFYLNSVTSTALIPSELVQPGNYDKYLQYGALFNKITTTTYNFGVKTIKTNYVLNTTGKIYKLTDNIDLSGRLWTPIGYGVDNIKVTTETTYVQHESIISQGTMFKGSLDGNGYTIVNMSAIGTNENVGLFGTVYTTSGLPFAQNLIIKASSIISVSNNDGFAVAGALAGRIVFNENSNAVYKVGTQDANVYATNRASGLIGDMFNISTTKGQQWQSLFFKIPSLKYVYVNSNVYTHVGGGSVQSAITHFGNNVTLIDLKHSAGNLGNALEIQYQTSLRNNNEIIEHYFVGELGIYNSTNKVNSIITNGTELKSNDSNTSHSTSIKHHSINYSWRFFGNSPFAYSCGNGGYELSRNSFYAVGFIDYTSMNESGGLVSDSILKTEALSNFSWGSAWTRTNDANEGYPILITEATYWALDHNVDLEERKIKSAYNSATTFQIENASKLAAFANLVNNGYSFEGKTITLANSINLASKVWSSIGYSDSNSFKGTFDFAGHTIKNMVTTGTYIPDASEPANIKCVGSNQVGLFGYTNGATITSSSGSNGQITCDNDYSYAIGSKNVGALVGYALNTNISNVTVSKVYVQGTDPSSTTTGVGGVVGQAYVTTDATFRNVINNSNISTSSNNVGGIVGFAAGTTSLKIYACQNNGQISADSYVGGIIGNSSADINININGADLRDARGLVLSDNTASITGISRVGGIAGQILKGSISSVTNGESANTITIFSDSNINGGIVGSLGASASIFEAINYAKIQASLGGEAGGIVGKTQASSANDTSSVVNVLNYGMITADGTHAYSFENKYAQIVGSIINKTILDRIYCAVDLHFNNDQTGNVYLIGQYKDTDLVQNYKNIPVNGVMSYRTLYEDSNETTLLESNTDIDYGDGNGKIKYDQVFEENPIWEGVKSNALKSAVVLKNKEPYEGEAPTLLNGVYQVSNYKHFIYLEQLNSRRFKMGATASIKLLNNITLRNENINGVQKGVAPIGKGAYPWSTDINGNRCILNVSKFDDSNTDYDSILGYVYGSSSNTVKIENLTVHYNVNSDTVKGGILLYKGIYAELNGVTMTTPGSEKTINIDSDFGTVAETLSYSTINNCKVSFLLNINNTKDSPIKMGGIVATAKASKFTNCEVKVIMRGDKRPSKAGGIVGEIEEVSNSQREQYKHMFKIDSCNVIPQYNFTSEESRLVNVGGLVGYDKEGYTYTNNKVGDIKTESSRFKSRDGYIKTITTEYGGGRAGGLVGYGDRSIIGTNNTNNAFIQGHIAGGMIAYANYCDIQGINKNVVNHGFVTGYYSGGLIGIAKGSVDISQAQNGERGEVNLTFIHNEQNEYNYVGYAGGLVGYIEADNNISNIKNCSVDGFISVTNNRVFNKVLNDTSLLGHQTVTYGVAGTVGYIKNTNMYTGITVTGYVGILYPGTETTMTQFNPANYNNPLESKKYKYYSTILVGNIHDHTGHEPGGNIWSDWGERYHDIDDDEYQVYDAKIDNNSSTPEINVKLNFSYGVVSRESSAITVTANTDNISNKIEFHDYYVYVNGNKGYGFLDCMAWLEVYEYRRTASVSTAENVTTWSEDETQNYGWAEATEDGWVAACVNIQNKTNEVTESNVANIELDVKLELVRISFYDGDKYCGYADTYVGEKFKPIVFNKEGYTFVSWNTEKDGSGTNWSAADTVTQKGNFKVYAQTQINQYAVEILDAVDESLVTTLTVDYNTNLKNIGDGYEFNNRPDSEFKGLHIYSIEQYNALVGDPKYTGTLKTFNYNYKNYRSTYASTHVDTTTDKVKGDLKLYAYYAPKFTITFNSNGGSSVVSQTIIQNGKVTKPNDPTKTGYKFAYWDKGGSAYNFNDEVTSSFELKAIWNPIVTLDYNDDEVTPNATGYVVYNGKLSTITVLTGTVNLNPTRYGYTFSGWDGGTGFDADTTLITAPKTLTAKWNAKTIPITYVEGGNETNTDLSSSVSFASKITKPSDPEREGYRFGGWYTDSSFTTEYDFDAEINSESDIWIFAEWIKVYKINFVYSLNGESPTIIDYREFAEDETIKTDGVEVLDIIGDDGYTYKFNGWYADSALTMPFVETKMETSEVTIYAKMVKQITVTVNINTEALGGSLNETKTYTIDVNDSLSTDQIAEINEIYNNNPVYGYNIEWQVGGLTQDLSTYKFTDNTTVTSAFSVAS